jgi:hypothetical protein
MYTLTNSAAPVIESQVKTAGIEHCFDGRLTTEGLNIYKPLYTRLGRMLKSVRRIWSWSRISCRQWKPEA